MSNSVTDKYEKLLDEHTGLYYYQEVEDTLQAENKSLLMKSPDVPKLKGDE